MASKADMVPVVAYHVIELETGEVFRMNEGAEVRMGVCEHGLTFVEFSPAFVEQVVRALMASRAYTEAGHRHGLTLVLGDQTQHDACTEGEPPLES